MKIVAEYSLEEILPRLGTGHHARMVVDGHAYSVKTGSTRLLLFMNHRTCVACGIFGTKFRLEFHRAEYLRKKAPRQLSDLSLTGFCYVEDCGRCNPILESRANPQPHLNLYARAKSPTYDPQWILMTQDHIIPKSKGGANDLTNLQPMCTECNRKKGDSMPSIDNEASFLGCSGMDQSI